MISPVIVVAMTLGTLFAFLANVSIVGYMWIYAIIYSCGALIFVWLAWRGPFLTVHRNLPHPTWEQSRAAE